MFRRKKKKVEPVEPKTSRPYLGVIYYLLSDTTVVIDRVKLEEGKIVFCGTINSPARKVYNFGQKMEVIAPDGSRIVWANLNDCVIDNTDGHLDNTSIYVTQPVSFTGQLTPADEFDWNKYEPLFVEIEALDS